MGPMHARASGYEVIIHTINDDGRRRKSKPTSDIEGGRRPQAADPRWKDGLTRPIIAPSSGDDP